MPEKCTVKTALEFKSFYQLSKNPCLSFYSKFLQRYVIIYVGVDLAFKDQFWSHQSMDITKYDLVSMLHNLQYLAKMI